jgi:small multidrug resistance family-3 protein
MPARTGRRPFARSWASVGEQRPSDTVSELVRAIGLFGLAGLAEIGGGWLVWQFLRESRPWPFGLLGALVLVSYGVIVTFQADPHFGRVYAAYGGIFIVMAMAWGFVVDGFRPDRWDLIGAGICLVGMLVIFFGPRSG